jgi:hypothetical protein
VHRFHQPGQLIGGNHRDALLPTATNDNYLTLDSNLIKHDRQSPAEIRIVISVKACTFF